MKPAFSTARPVAALGPSVRLPAQDLAQIRFIVAAADMRANVRRMALLLSGRNAAAAAEAIAKELRRNLYRIDLAAVMSEFIGETEKNLGRVFAEGEMCPRSQVVLHVRKQGASEPALIGNDDVIETFAPNGPDQPFRIRVGVSSRLHR